jgi:hypothetical protein
MCIRDRLLNEKVALNEMGYRGKALARREKALENQLNAIALALKLTQN